MNASPLQSKKLQVVILECPYDQWENPEVQRLFNRVVSLKLSGYLSAYPYGVIPVDTFDFVGSHHLVCEDRGGELYPIMGYKTTTLSRATIHNLPFPALSILRQSGATAHADELERILNRCRDEKREIGYDGSWTISPEVRDDKPVAAALKKLLMAINVNYHLQSPGKELTGFGMLRFKTDQYFKFFGYEPIASNGRLLPTLKMSTLQGEPAVFMHLRAFTPEVVQESKAYLSYWDNRKVLQAKPANSETKEAA